MSSVDEGRGLFGATSELVVKKTGSEEFEFEFRGGDKAQRAYKLIMTGPAKPAITIKVRRRVN